jgi:hypothetical protein
VQVTVTGASAGLAWLVPVRPGARLDLASDAWLDALDAATAPVVLPPTTPGCIGGSDPDRVAPTTSPASTNPTRTEILTDLGAINALLTDAGYALPAGLASGVTAALASGDSIAALLFPSAALPLHTLRIVDAGAPSLPFALSGSTFGDMAVTGFVVSSGPESAGTDPITLDPTTVLWVANAQSTYPQATAVLVQQWQGTRWLTQSAMPGLLFSGASIAGTSSLPAVLGQYFTLAASYGDATSDPGECTAAAASTQSEAGSFVATCPDGALAIVAGPGPCAIGSAGALPVDALSCGGNSVDAALAVADLSPEQLWVTRLDGMVTLESASDVSLAEGPAASSGPGGSLSPVLTAGGYDCPSSGGGGTGDPGGGATLGGGDPSGSGAAAAADVASNGCAAGLESCDSSSDSSDDSGGCGSSDSSSGDSGCGGSDAGGGGGGCGGDGGGGSCTTARQARHHARGRRSPVSRVLLLCAAVAIVARRHSRNPA